MFNCRLPTGPASILFGDRQALLVEPSLNGYGWEDEYLRSDGIGAEWLNIKSGGLFTTSNETIINGII